MKWHWYTKSCDGRKYKAYLPIPTDRPTTENADTCYGEVCYSFGWGKNGYWEGWEALLYLDGDNFDYERFNTEQEAKDYVEKNLITKVNDYLDSNIAELERFRIYTH